MADFGMFIKRPTQIEAYHYISYTAFMTDMENKELPEWVISAYKDQRIRLKDPYAPTAKKVMIVASKDGDYVLRNRDWIIKNPDNTISPCHQGIFEQEYVRLKM